MHSISVKLLAALFPLLIFTDIALAGDDRPDKAVCHVCAEHGETHGPEKVNATSTYGEVTYYFCSEKCKESFDADPAGYMLQIFPRPAPRLNARDLSGKSPTLDEYTDAVLLVDFWATWCKPCVEIMPKLQELHATFEEDGFQVLGISIDEDPEKVKKFLAKRNVDYRIAIDDPESPTWGTYGVKAVPTSFLIGRDGQIVARWVGKPNLEEVKKTVSLALEKQHP